MPNERPDWSRPVVLFEGFADNEPKRPDFTDEDLVQFLTTFPDAECAAATCVGRKCPAKRGAWSWSPVSYANDATRSNDGVLAINYVVLDLDHCSDAALAGVLERLADYEHIVHSTHSHEPPLEGSYRLVLPVSRAIAPADLLAVREAVVAVFALPSDPSCDDLARLYACPTQRLGVEPFATHRRGEVLDVEEALAVAREMRGARPVAPQPVAVPAPAVAPASTKDWDLAELRVRLSEIRRSKASAGAARDGEAGLKLKLQADLVGRVLEGRPLADVGGRHAARVRLCGVLAYWLPPDVPWAVVLELLRPCLAATPLGENDTFEAAVEKTRDLFESSRASRLEADAKRAGEQAAIRKIVTAVRGRASPSADEIAAAADGNPDAWMDLLLLERKGPKACEHNARLLLTCAPELRGTIRWNEVTKSIEVVGGPLAGVGLDSLDAAAAAWLQSNFAFQGGAWLMRGAFLQVARENPYDPIAEYLNELAWDRQPRLDAFLEEYMGAEPADDDQRTYVRAVSRRWLIGLVARALRPGCKLDNVLVLEGRQGVKKSSALEAIVGGTFFLDTALELGSKDSMQAIATAWLVELGEMASLSRVDADRQKQILSSKVDRFRPPYGATMVDSPRRCVFVATTNGEDNYLRDRTGNRRFWPVRVERPDPAAIARDRDLILGEAVAAFRAGERWWLTDAEADLQAKEAEERVDESTIAEAISRWWYGEKPDKRPRRLTTLDVAELALRLPQDRVTRSVQVEIGHAMKRLGFERRRRMVKGEKTKYYEPSPDLLEAPKQTSAARQAGMSLVAEIKKKAGVDDDAPRG